MVTNLAGKTLAGRYQFEDRIGEGTFAQVYRVHDQRRSVDLAAKVLRTDIAHESNFIVRFRREAEVLARLQHPNIVRYYDLVEAGEFVFILMDYVPGQTLQSTLYHIGQPFNAREVVEFLRPLSAALHFAHGEGVIHRDLKPANVLIHENGNLLVTDFGIARFLDDAAMSLTGGRALGTPLYMAPEQITGKEISPSTDVYALGVMLYQMLVQRVPFDGSHPEAKGDTTSERVTYEHLHIPPEPLRNLNDRVDESVEVIVMQCLKKEPERRPDSVRTVYDLWAEAVGTVAVDLSTDQHQAVAPPDVKLPELSQFDVPAPDVRQERSQPTVENQSVDDPNKTLKAEPFAPPHPQDSIPQPQATSPTPPPGYGYGDAFDRPSFDPMRFLLLGVALAILACIALGIYTFVPLGGDDDTSSLNGTDEPTFDLTENASVSTEDSIRVGGSNGSKIAFAARIEGPLSIYVSDVNGNDPERLLDIEELQQQGPSWSPDGSQIAFYGLHGDASAPGDIYVMNSDGSNLRNLTDSADYNDRYVTWAPDGENVVFHSNRPGQDGSRDYEIYTIDLTNGELTQLTFNNLPDYGPDWSPDGEKIAFFSYIGNEAVIYTMTPDGEDRTQISPDDLPGGASYPAWSPDNSQIAFHVQMQPGVFQVYIMDADGSKARPLMDLYVNDQFPDWSADGQSIIFQRVEDEVRTIYRYSLVDGSLTLVREGYLPDWQPVN